MFIPILRFNRSTFKTSYYPFFFFLVAFGVIELEILSSYVYTNLVSFGPILKDSFKTCTFYTHNEEVRNIFHVYMSIFCAPRNTALTLRFFCFCCFLRLLMPSLQGVSCFPGPQWMAKPSLCQGCQPVQWDLAPPARGLAALPEWVLPSFHWEGKCCCCSQCLSGGGRGGKTAWSVQKWVFPPSLGLRSTVSEVFFECFILGMNLTGSSTRPRLLRTAVIWRTPAGPVPTADELANSMHLCAFCLKFRLKYTSEEF